MKTRASQAPGPSPTSQYGVVGQAPDGHSLALFRRRLQHGVAKVWAAIVEPGQRAIWAPGIHFEAKPKGRFELWFGDHREGPPHVSGTLTAFEPPRLIQLGSIRLALEADAPGCLLHFSDVFWFDDKRTRTEFINTVLGGWHQFLDTLELWLDEGRYERLPEPDYAHRHVPGRDSETAAD